MNFCQFHLNRVSRSFAFCIEQLDSPFRDWISISYLLLRVLDTIEDSFWLTKESQIQSFDQFSKFLESMPSASEIDVWADQFPPSASKDELQLVRESYKLFDLYHAIDKEPRELIKATALEMAYGMKKFGALAIHSKGVLQLQNNEETDEYCDYVAGIVGRLILNLYNVKYPSAEFQEQKNKSRAMSFGRVLQKINMIKDRKRDLSENRNFIASWPGLIETLMRDMEDAVTFIGYNFAENSSLRVFCAWSLGIGIDFLTRTLNAGEKLNRQDLQLLLGRLFEVAQNQTELKTFFAQRFLELRNLISSRSNFELPA